MVWLFFVKHIVGRLLHCILFGLNCCLAGRSDACKAAWPCSPLVETSTNSQHIVFSPTMTHIRVNRLNGEVLELTLTEKEANRLMCNRDLKQFLGKADSSSWAWKKMVKSTSTYTLGLVVGICLKEFKDTLFKWLESRTTGWNPFSSDGASCVSGSVFQACVALSYAFPWCGWWTGKDRRLKMKVKWIGSSWSKAGFKTQRDWGLDGKIIHWYTWQFSKTRHEMKAIGNHWWSVIFVGISCKVHPLLEFLCLWRNLFEWICRCIIV